MFINKSKYFFIFIVTDKSDTESECQWTETTNNDNLVAQKWKKRKYKLIILNEKRKKNTIQ